jgi:hypothetical protein
VTLSTQRDEIFLTIIARLTPKFFVMDLESTSCATALALPPVSPQDLRMESVIRIGIQPKPATLWLNLPHDAV